MAAMQIIIFIIQGLMWLTKYISGLIEPLTCIDIVTKLRV